VAAGEVDALRALADDAGVRPVEARDRIAHVAVSLAG
jgi:hypothetical protein